MIGLDLAWKQNLAQSYSWNCTIKYIRSLFTKDVELPPQAICYKLLHLFATYNLKLHFLKHLCEVGKRCGTNYESYLLKTRIVHLLANYLMTPPIWIRFLRLIKDAKLPLKAKPRPKEQKIYRSKWVKDRRSTFSSLLLFSSTLFQPYFSINFSTTTNDLQYATSSSCAFPVIRILLLSSTNRGQRNFFFFWRILLFPKETFPDQLTLKKFLYTQVYT